MIRDIFGSDKIVRAHERRFDPNFELDFGVKREFCYGNESRFLTSALGPLCFFSAELTNFGSNSVPISSGETRPRPRARPCWMDPGEKWGVFGTMTVRTTTVLSRTVTYDGHGDTL